MVEQTSENLRNIAVNCPFNASFKQLYQEIYAANVFIVVKYVNNGQHKSLQRFLDSSSYSFKHRSSHCSYNLP